MLILAMLLATDYPAFDAAQAATLCEAKRKEESWASIYSTNQACVADQAADHRRVLIVTRHGEAEMEPSFLRCTRDWHRDGAIDWGMVEYCVVGNVDGRRDFLTLRKSAPSVIRPAIDKCVKSSTDDGATDWADAADCAREQASGYRDFLLFRADAQGKDRTAIEACRKSARDDEDGVTDWDDALRCAARGGPATVPGGQRPDNEIILT